MAGRGTEQNPLFMEQVPGSLRLAGWVVLLVALMLADHRHHWLNQARQQTAWLFEPVFLLLELPGQWGRRASAWLMEQQQLIERTQALEQENIRLRVERQQWLAQQKEQAAIAQLLQPLARLEQSLIIARVVELNHHPFGTRVLLNQGAEEGVVPGMAALDARGVAGQVITVLPHHAWVMLISDPDHALPVRLAGNGTRSIVVGRGRADWLEAINLPLSVAVETGDLLETSGIGGRFPPGYPVAVVQSVRRVPGERFAHVRVTPLAPLDRLRFLALGHWPEQP